MFSKKILNRYLLNAHKNDRHSVRYQSHKEGKGTVASLKKSVFHESILVNYAFALLVINTNYLFTYAFNIYLWSIYYVLDIVLGEPNQQNSLPLRNLHSNAGKHNKHISKFTSESSKCYEEKT